MKTQIQLVAPDGDVVPVRYRLAPRLRSLAGKVVAVLDNTKPNADTILTTAAAALVRDHGAREYRVFSKPNPAVPFQERDKEALLACDLLVTGTGD